MLDREEYIEQSHFYRLLAERMKDNLPVQEILLQAKAEVLATTKLPLAIDFLLAELKHTGVIASAMARLAHYFTAFQTYVIAEAESDTGRFDFRVGLEILRREAEYRSAGGSPQGIFFYEFECLARNRLSYDRGLKAIAADPSFDDAWREWILTVRRQIGLVDLCDMVYVRSEYCRTLEARRTGDRDTPPVRPILFGEKEGRIALANRQRDPLFMFAAMQRQLGYPQVPRPQREEEEHRLLYQLMRKVEQLETRIKLQEEEQKGGIDITRFYVTSPEKEPRKPS